MGDPRLTFTPRGEVGDTHVDFTHGLQLYQREPRSDRVSTVSAGGLALALVNDVYAEIRLRCDGISRLEDADLYHGLRSFIGHAEQGGLFSFALDQDKIIETTIDGAHTRGDTTIATNDVVSPELETYDPVYFEDAVDPLKYEVRQAMAFWSTGVTLGQGIMHSYADDSIVRYAEYQPACQAVARRAARLRERAAGNGADLFDFDLRFRSVRNS